MKDIAREILENYTYSYAEVDVERLAKRLEEIRKETAKEIAEMLKAAKGVVKVHFESYDELIENIYGKYGIELFENFDKLEDEE